MDILLILIFGAKSRMDKILLKRIQNPDPSDPIKSEFRSRSHIIRYLYFLGKACCFGNGKFPGIPWNVPAVLYEGNSCSMGTIFGTCQMWGRLASPTRFHPVLKNYRHQDLPSFAPIFVSKGDLTTLLQVCPVTVLLNFWGAHYERSIKLESRFHQHRIVVNTFSVQQSSLAWSSKDSYYYNYFGSIKY